MSFQTAVVLCAMVSLLGGCGRGDAPTTAKQIAGSDRVESEALINALAAMLERESSTGDVEVASLRPDDVELHPRARVETLELLALVRSDENQSYSVQQRIDRFALRHSVEGNSDEAAGARDYFRADAMARYTGAIAVGNQVDRREVVERVTLGLASFGVRAAKVRDVAIELVEIKGANSDCRLDYTVADGLGLALRFRQSRCGTAGLTAGFATALSEALDVSGEFQSGGERVSVVGKGWLRRGWGNMPAPGGAIVFDRLILELDGVGQIDALRSKRLSGRGPMQTTATLAGQPRDNGELQWLDEDALSDVDSWHRWHLIDAASGIDIEIVPVAVMSDEANVFGAGLHGAVVASGTHTGMGFVDVVPTDAGAVLE